MHFSRRGRHLGGEQFVACRFVAGGTSSRQLSFHGNRCKSCVIVMKDCYNVFHRFGDIGWLVMNSGWEFSLYRSQQSDVTNGFAKDCELIWGEVKSWRSGPNMAYLNRKRIGWHFQSDIDKIKYTLRLFKSSSWIYFTFQLVQTNYGHAVPMFSQ